MSTIKLKTNINCSGCVAKVTPVLDKAVGANNWKVDTEHQNKLLTVNTDELSAKEIIKTVEKAGFKATAL